MVRLTAFEFLEAMGKVGFEGGLPLEQASEVELCFDDEGVFRSVHSIKLADEKIVVVLGPRP